MYIIGIEFVKEPRDVHVPCGSNAFFPCTYTGTNGIPLWRINGALRPINILPFRHKFNGTGMVISDVDDAMNGTLYQCCFIIANKEINSTTGALIVKSAMTENNSTSRGASSSTLLLFLFPALVWAFQKLT